MAAFLGIIRPHKLVLLAIMLGTWSLMLVAFRYGGRNLRNLQPRRVLVAVLCITLWIVAMAWDDPRADYGVAVCLGIGCSLPLVELLERRSSKKTTP